MAVSQRTLNLLAIALGDLQASQELASADNGLPTTPSFTTVTTTGNLLVGGVVEVGGKQVVGAQQTAPVNVAVTFTASAPANYASPTGSLTIANGGTPTVVELVEYCDELRGVLTAILLVLHTHGLTT